MNNNSPVDIDEICDDSNLGYDADWDSDHCNLNLVDSDSEYEAKIYFINSAGDVIGNSGEIFENIDAIRSVGIEKINDEDIVTRALQTDLNSGS